MMLFTAGCAKKVSALSEKEYWSQVKSLKRLPQIKLDGKETGAKNMNILAKKVDVATAIIPPVGLEGYHEQLIKTVNLFYDASRISYMSVKNPAFKEADAAEKLLAGRIEWQVLNNWFPPKGAHRADVDEYFATIERFFIDEQQSANKAFNAYITSENVTNAGIAERLSANNNALEKEKRELLNTIPPKKIIYLHRDFLRVFLLDEQANNLYEDALKAEDKDVAEELISLSTDYSNRADKLLADSLKELSIKTGHKKRWLFN